MLLMTKASYLRNSFANNNHKRDFYRLINCYIEKRLKVFLDTLLELNEIGANFSDDELRDEVVTMMIGVCTSIY